MPFVLLVDLAASTLTKLRFVSCGGCHVGRYAVPSADPALLRLPVP